VSKNIKESIIDESNWGRKKLLANVVIWTLQEIGGPGKTFFFNIVTKVFEK